jgi:photosystem II stability/assembly factor-like uncharacterized protein
VSPSIIYVGAWGGVSKSTDGGQNWADASSGLGQKTVLALTLNPLTPSILYAATWEDGVYKSSNGGSGWLRASAGIEDVHIRDLVIDPTRPDILYAATDESGVFKTVDGGNSWAPVRNGISGLQCFRLLVDPGRPDTIYLGTQGRGIFKSIDGCASWQVSSPDLPEDCTPYALAINSGANIVYAGLFSWGVYRARMERPTGSHRMPALPDIPSAL